MSIRFALGRVALVLAVPVAAMGTAAGSGAVTPSTSGWTLVASPDRTARTDNALSGAACPTTLVCLAVGFVVLGRVEKTLALRGP
jgi:hypothetical protein